jgi:hypothetical protein
MKWTLLAMDMPNLLDPELAESARQSYLWKRTLDAHNIIFTGS